MTGDIMNANDLDPLQAKCHGYAEGAKVAAKFLIAEYFCDEAFSRVADQ